MGTRLYVQAPEHVLETLCGAPAGAWRKCKEIVEKFGDCYDQASYEAREKEFEKHEGTGDCYGFDLFGFGKLNREQWNYLKTVVDEENLYGGSSTDPVFISTMLALISEDRGGAEAWRCREQITKIYWS